LRPTWANSSRDPITKITKAKWTGGAAQAVEYLFNKHTALNSNPSLTTKKERKIAHRSVYEEMDELAFHTMESCLVLKRNKILTHAMHG
jgi:hypothetical protein